MPPTLTIHYRTAPGERVVADDGETHHPLEWAGDGWWVGAVDLVGPYRYAVATDDSLVPEAGALRPVPDGDIVVDRWRGQDPAARSRSSALFSRALSAHHPDDEPSGGATTFRVLEPWVEPGTVPAIVGSDPALGEWDPERAVPLAGTGFPWWETAVDLEGDPGSVSYKYVLVGDAGTTWEEGPDRSLPDLDGVDVVIDNGIRGVEPWRGAGVAVPVFSLRTTNSLGVGQFTDLAPFVDWAADAGCSVVQILPVNDTVKTHDWQDSYPYDPVSVHALHPLYLDLAEVAARHPKAATDLAPGLADAKARLDPRPEVEYEEVMAVKWPLALAAFDACIDTDAEDVAAFAAAEWEWLGPYAAWCVLRDVNGTPDMAEWGPDATFDPARVDALADASSPAHREMTFHCWLQYHLHRQLDAAVAHARSRGVAIKGDLPIGVSPTSVEVWTHPELFRAGTQTGAPPDAFATRGQNWGFPTYVWDAMAADDYAWWQARFEAMARSVDAYRIDHVLGFFRIWEVPEGEIDGLLGRFRPCLPLDGADVAAELGIDTDDLTEPWIDADVLADRLGDGTVEGFFVEREDGRLAFAPGLDDQRSVAEATERAGLDESTSRVLLDLRGEVLCLAVEGGVHPRISWGETEAYQRLDEEARRRFDAIASDFFFHRHEEFWAEQGRTTLRALLESTDLLACGEDLGFVPRMVPVVMAELGVLSLEIERMPKAMGAWIADPATAPYASVVSPATHDMAPVRQWWEEMDAETRQRYWEEVLGHHGPAPVVADPETCELVVRRQFDSPAMLAILPIQDLLAMDGQLRRPDPRERINEPASRHHHWRWRLHLSAEDLADAEAFTARVRSMVRNSGRQPPANPTG